MVVRSSVRTDELSAKFVRLAQLRKLRKCEQVAAVCYRVGGSGIEFLLVRTRGSGRWTFPKGSAEPGLTHAQAAALEAFEEAGVHGRIEEASFAQYRRKPGKARKSGRRIAGNARVVNAHLCEVLRLSFPQESRRNRTWFSVEDAKLRLREGRKGDDAAEFVRVVEKAVARIRQLRCGAVVVDDRLQQDKPRWESQTKDGLQKVRFDFAEAYGRAGEPSFGPYIRRQLGEMRRFVVPIVEAHSHEVLRGEVLQFDPAREKKPRF
jgi:8-oxo-dGTP pyrophosphatase MutT (NUDIX family)